MRSTERSILNLHSRITGIAHRCECFRVEYIGIKSNFHYNPYPITWGRLPGWQEMARALFRAAVECQRLDCRCRVLRRK